jgi:hypothetical protein
LLSFTQDFRRGKEGRGSAREEVGNQKRKQSKCKRAEIVVESFFTSCRILMTKKKGFFKIS